MKLRNLVLASLTLMYWGVCQAQKPVFTDASAFPVFGKAVENTSARYERLPSSLENVTRPPVWRLGRDAAGVYVRFRSNTTAVSVRWKSTFKHAMNHMTPVGDRGLDLYAMDRGRWYFAGCAKPDLKSDSTEVLVVKNMTSDMREYMLYLSLYDGVSALEIGVDSGALLEGPAINSPVAEKPIIMYGTSILQGGCANRPGMVHTSIIERELGRQVINLGFSGNALLDYEIAELIAQVKDPGVIVLDYAPNSGAKTINEKGEAFFRIVRDAHPDVPIILVETPTYTNARFDTVLAAELASRNKAQKALYNKLRKAGEKNLYYVKGDNLIGDDGEATVDGCHFTDLGMTRYAAVLTPVIKKALKKR